MGIRSIDNSRSYTQPPSTKLVAAGAVIALMGAAGLLFSTPPASAIGTAVDLGTAESYSVLGGESVTNTGPSVLNNDLGVSPGTAISGFPPGLANGTVHQTDAHAAQAQSDLVIAYDAAAGQAPDATISDDIGGRTLVPGVYKGSSSIGITGPLTLDAQGDPNAVFIFQIGSTLTTATSSSVVLLNGAQSCNVFWQIGSSATLGTNTTFVGNILALTSITANTGTTVDGRALARNGSVTLDTNTFTGGPCATTSPTSTTTATVTATTTATNTPTVTATTTATTTSPTSTATTTSPTSTATTTSPTSTATTTSPTSTATTTSPTSTATTTSPTSTATTTSPTSTGSALPTSTATTPSTPGAPTRGPGLPSAGGDGPFGGAPFLQSVPLITGSLGALVAGMLLIVIGLRRESVRV